MPVLSFFFTSLVSPSLSTTFGLFRTSSAQPLYRSAKKSMQNGVGGIFLPEHHPSRIEVMEVVFAGQLSLISLSC